MHAYIRGRVWDLMGIADYNDILVASKILEAFSIDLGAPVVRFYPFGAPKGFDAETGEVGVGAVEPDPTSRAEPEATPPEPLVDWNHNERDWPLGDDLISPCTSDT